MTKDEELEQLRTDNTILYEALLGKKEELEQSLQANQALRDGLKQALIAIDSQQERVKVLEGLIESQQERIKDLERHQAKDSHNSSLPPPIILSVSPRACGKRVARKLVDNTAIVDISFGRSRSLMRCSFIPSSVANDANMICVLS